MGIKTTALFVFLLLLIMDEDSSISDDFYKFITVKSVDFKNVSDEILIIFINI